MGWKQLFEYALHGIKKASLFHFKNSRNFFFFPQMNEDVD